jgi:general stress protein CsbA
MLVVFPLLAFATLVSLMATLFPELGWRRSFLRAALAWGIWLVISTEALSLIKALTPIGLSLAWLTLALFCAGWLVLRLRKGFSLRRPVLDGLRKPINAVMMVVIIIIFVLTMVVAWFAPPNTFDSLNYHMSRVAHWAQNHSVAHYPSGMELQNSYAPLAEYSILHFYILSGGDHLANFSEWFAMAGSVVGASLAAALLGAALPGQLLAAIFVASLPMGIVQASSTMTDYVTGFWLVCLSVEFLALRQGKEKAQWVVLFMSASAGLAAATKPTAFAFMLPFVLTAPVILLRQVKFSVFVRLVVFAFIIFASINAGYMARNLRTYGVPFDPANTVSFRNEMMNVGGLTSNILRNASLQLHTPWPEVNYQLTRLIIGIHFKLGMDVNDPRTTAQGEFNIGNLTTNEDVTFNPLHALLIGIVLLASLVFFKRTSRRLMIYQALVILGFVTFSFIFKWQIFGSRLLLPFFLLYAPVVGTFFSILVPAWFVSVVGVGLAASSFMWLVSINSRPLIPLPGRTEWPSVLTASREQMYFTSISGAYEPMKSITGQILDAECNEVAIVISGAGAEYPYWLLLGAPRDDLRIEWIVAGTPSARYSDPNFEPCAVICDTCADTPSYRGLPLVDERGKIRLYLRK